MYYSGFINSDFTDYLNRHLKGIALLKNVLGQISISFELSEAFSNFACRFSIDVDFNDEETLSKGDLAVANMHFHNMWSTSGSKFVSFIYKSNKEHHINIEVVKSFIVHYEFAQKIFEGFIQGIIPDNCKLKIVSLDTSPFFLYIKSFLGHSKYNRDTTINFNKAYFELTRREFEFDCFYHQKLLEAEKLFSNINSTDSISDKEICEAKGGDIESIRQYVLEEGIPFNNSYKWDNIVSEIQIDVKTLRTKMQTYHPRDLIKLVPAVIVRLLEERESQKQHKENLLLNLLQKSEIEHGDYILVAKDILGRKIQEVGIIKEINLSYKEKLEIKYVLLKKDFSESKIPQRSTYLENISHILHPQEINSEEYSFIKKNHLAAYLEKKGRKNTAFNQKK